MLRYSAYDLQTISIWHFVQLCKSKTLYFVSKITYIDSTYDVVSSTCCAECYTWNEVLRSGFKVNLSVLTQLSMWRNRAAKYSNWFGSWYFKKICKKRFFYLKGPSPIFTKFTYLDTLKIHILHRMVKISTFCQFLAISYKRYIRKNI